MNYKTRNINIIDWEGIKMLSKKLISFILILTLTFNLNYVFAATRENGLLIKHDDTIAGQFDVSFNNKKIKIYYGTFKAHKNNAYVIIQNMGNSKIELYINGQKIYIPRDLDDENKDLKINIGPYVNEGENDIVVYSEKVPNKTRIIIPYLELRAGTPEEVGMLSETLNKIDKIVNDAINKGITPGAVVLVAKDGVIVKNTAYGYAQKYDMGKLLDEPRLMMTNTIFDLASVTKVMATTQAIMQLVSQGKLKVTDKVSKYIPDFAQNGKGDITIADLLTHTSGLSPWKPLYYHAKNADEVLEYICKLPLEYKTGTDRKYSDIGFMTLGFVIKAITGKDVDEYTRENIYSKLGMKDTMFNPLKDTRDLKWRIAATSWGNPFEYKMVAQPGWIYPIEEKLEDWNGWRNYTLVGEANDGNCFYANSGVAGHAGLFSTANDLAILGQAMLNGGGYGTVKLYDKSVLDEFTSLKTPPKGWTDYQYGYGWEIARSSYMGNLVSSKAFGHSGFTGTQIIFDPEYNLQIIVLTNKQNNGVNEKGMYPSTFKLTRDISDIVYQSMVKY
ncbi:MAG: serine hydrolase [Thermoanaerobacterium sp.]|nr:serine hydrolase [Thermoanaerobacterium sp.]